MVSMLVGRPISAIGGILVLILLSRHTPADQYGVYFAIWALIEIAILSSNCGLLHAVYRYISARVTADGLIIPVGPVWPILAWRCLTLLLAGFFIYILPPGVAQLFNLDAAEHYALFIAAIIGCEGIARFIEAIFDSMLCQGYSQLTLISRTFFRLLGIGYILIFTPEFSLHNIIVSEFIATCIGATLGLLLLIRLYHKRGKTEAAPPSPGFARMTRFALPAFIAQVLGIVYGPDMLKLVLSGGSGVQELAIFGFAYSIAAVVQRYIPANLLAGVFRPLFVAAAKKDNADKVLLELLTICIKINWIFVAPLLCAAYFFGDPVLQLISAGNYSQAGSVITVIIAGLFPVAVHLTFSQYCLAVENSWPPLFATLAAMLGLPIGLMLAKYFGALGVAIAFGAGEAIWCVVCAILLLRWRDAVTYADIFGCFKVLLIIFTSIGVVGLAQHFLPLHWLFSAGLLGVVFAGLTYMARIFNVQEGQWLLAVLPFGSALKRLLKLR